EARRELSGDEVHRAGEGDRDRVGGGRRRNDRGEREAESAEQRQGILLRSTGSAAGPRCECGAERRDCEQGERAGLRHGERDRVGEGPRLHEELPLEVAQAEVPDLELTQVERGRNRAGEGGGG